MMSQFSEKFGRRAVSAKAARQLRTDDRGAALVTVMLFGVVIASVIAITAANALNDLNRATSTSRSSAAYQAAEAGVADYISKLNEDRSYYAHYVHPAESTRTSASSVFTAGAGQAWNGDPAWTYPAAYSAWRALPNGYQFNLEITPPASGSTAIKIVSTGRKNGATKELRRIEVVIRPSSVADWMMISNTTLSYGATATTTGRLYAGITSSGAKANIQHAGQVRANLYAEGNITTYASTVIGPGVQLYNQSNIRTILPSPVNFNNFTGALVDVHVAALTPNGLNLDDATAASWRITFNANATLTYRKCTTVNPHTTTPSCAATATTVPMPTNGAIYTGQTAVVGGVVDGQVTLASNVDIVIGENLTYEVPGNDVLGLIAKDDDWIASWSPSTMTVMAAMIAQEGHWSQALDGSGNPVVAANTKFSFTHVGSVAKNDTGSMTMFQNRSYQYDPNLAFLVPPYFPVIEEAYNIQGERELVAPPLP